MTVSGVAPRIVVIGGGLSGLAAAHRVLERAPDADVTVLEASPRAGGILGTIERDGFVIETGPDSILTEKPAALALAARLGIADRVIGTETAHRGAYVVSRGRLERVPEGFSLMAPSRWDAWMKTPIVSGRGKLRAALEVVLPRRRRDDRDEESLAAFVRRRFGDELLDRLAQPLVGGIYGADPETLSLAATMPRFVAMERERGSVIRAMRATRSAGSKANGGAGGEASGARYGLFAAFDRGMQVLIDALTARLGDRVRTASPARGLVRRQRWCVQTEGEALDADRVIVAVPAWRAASLLRPHDVRLADGLDAIEYGSAATVTFAWARAEIPHPLDAFGFVVPAVERRAILAATFSSVKWRGRAPAGQVLLRVFFGGAHDPDAAARTDEELEASARRELRALMGIGAPPRFAIVTRYPRAMPQYQLGHLDRVAAIEARVEALPALALASNALRGVGIPDTIASAERAADRLLAR